MGGGLTVASGWHLLGGGVATLWFNGRWLWDGWGACGGAGEVFWMCQWTKRFSCVALIFVCEFLVDGTGMVMILLMSGAFPP